MRPSPRWSSDTARRVALGALALAAVPAGVAAEDWTSTGSALPDALVGWIAIGCGLTATARRPQSRSGWLLTATGFGWLAPGVFDSTAMLYVHRAPLVHLVATYPTGRTSDRRVVLATAAGYAAAVVEAVWRSQLAAIALSAALVAVVALARRGAVGGERRRRLAAVRATACLSGLISVIAVVRLAEASDSASAATLYAYEASLALLFAVLLIGLLAAPWERVGVTDLVVDLGEGRSATVRDALARALGDPSLEVGYWLPEAGGYVDAEGRALALPGRDARRSATLVGRDGAPVAVLIHDPAVLRDPGLLEAVTSAARLAAENARLRAEVRARTAAVDASRQRVIAATSEQRDRIERRLKAGARGRLAELAATLERARAVARDAETLERIGHAQEQITVTQDELHRLARGLHPHELAAGLHQALAALAETAPVPVALRVESEPASAAAQGCVYFVCAEALANVTKHAPASRARVKVERRRGVVVVEIEDDGPGGADPARGSGLQGLRDRVAALGGHLTIESPPGGGTRLTAVVPDA